jgi:hypothetical protein
LTIWLLQVVVVELAAMLEEVVAPVDWFLT